MGDIGDLQKKYKTNNTFKTFFKKFMGLALIPTEAIPVAIGHLQGKINEMDRRNPDLQRKAQQLLNYVMTNWINGPMWKHPDWCAFQLYVRTNNYLEGFHSRLNSRMGSKKHPTFSDLVTTLYNESKEVAMTIAELASGEYVRRVNKSAVERDIELRGLNHRYETGELSSVQLLEAVSEGIGRPDNRFMNFLADPEDPQGTFVDDDDPDDPNEIDISV